jgi:hypothetical protein
VAGLTPHQTRTRQQHRRACVRLVPARLAVVLCLLLAAPLDAQLVRCAQDADAPAIARALLAIERSEDPCGESSELRAMLDALRSCSRATYEICTDGRMDRNVFDRSPDATRTITWNPTLTSELEVGCNDDPHRPVLRDPTASLVHELAHAAQDCQGLNPGAHELEAVRIENIYRRAAGLCQRRGYGDEALPADMVKPCTAAACQCSSPTEMASRPADQLAPAAPAGGDGSTFSGDSRVPRHP